MLLKVMCIVFSVMCVQAEQEEKVVNPSIMLEEEEDENDYIIFRVIEEVTADDFDSDDEEV
ncbi:MAG: hypothetical protein KA802_17615 [Saprospiraceae bacterium]|nr:hypothetical protein [Saprospiraceae bacterium]